MKKILAIILAGGIVLAGCSFNISENEDGSTKVKIDVEKEEKETRKASEVEAVGDVIRFDEFDILLNEVEAYQNRPFENVPVHIDNVDRYSDHSIVRAKYSDDSTSVTFVLRLDTNQLDFEEGDHGYLSGVVATDIEIDYPVIYSIPSAFKNFDKVTEMEFHNPNLREIDVNQTKNTDKFEASIEKIVTGDLFTVIHYNKEYLFEDNSGYHISFKVYQNGNEFSGVHRSNFGLETDIEGEHQILPDLDVSQPFKIVFEISNIYSNPFKQEELNPIEFEFNGF